MNFIYVFLGGGLGAMTRYSISKILPTVEGGFPNATFIANVVSCIVLGLLMGTLMQKELSTKTQLILMTGFCGGFSTFSTFSAETFKLLEQGQFALALGYILSSIAICLVCIFIGMKLAESL